MKPRYTRRKISACVFWGRVAAVVVVLFPYALTRIDFRTKIAQPFTIAAYRASPAYAALEDLTENYAADVFELPAHAQRLVAGESTFVLPAAEGRQRQVILAGMKIHRPVEQTPIEEDFSTQVPVHLAAIRLSPSMTPQQLYADETASHDVSITSVSARAQELVQRELAQLSPVPAQKMIDSSTGTRILIARGESAPPAAMSPTPQPNANPPPESEPRGLFNGFMPTGENQRPLWLNGQIEMTGGLAFVGPETQLIVKRVHNGQTFEKGRIWISEGKFEIHVKSAIGYLIAELYTENGQVLGRGELNLLQLEAAAHRDSRIGDLRIALRPVTQTASMRATSGYSHGNTILPMASAKIEVEKFGGLKSVNDEGWASEPGLAKESTFVARAVAQKNWSTIVIGQTNRPQDIRLFSNSLIEALINLTQSGTDRAEAFHQAVVWGQISRDGQAVEGAEVELAGSLKPIYFDEAYIPDLRRTSTSKNGLFAFVRVKPGVQAVRVKHQSRTYPAQVFPSEARHVSYLEFDLRDRIVSEFRALDVLDLSKPISASVRLVGADAQAHLKGQDFVEYAAAANVFMVEATAGPEYEISRATLNGSPHRADIPLVRREWLDQLARENAIVQDPSRGIIMGFVDGRDFEAEMTGMAAIEKANIVYFDAHGRTLPSRVGSAGGGFAIFNAPFGLQTVYIHPSQGRESYAQVVVAEPQYVHVVSWANP